MSEFLNTYNLTGVVLGLCTFIIIGLFHPIVIKAHYYFGTASRWWFLVAGVLFILASLAAHSVFWSALLGVTAFSCLWSVREISEQEERVRKGWFPANPRRKGKGRAS